MTAATLAVLTLCGGGQALAAAGIAGESLTSRTRLDHGINAAEHYWRAVSPARFRRCAPATRRRRITYGPAGGSHAVTYNGGSCLAYVRVDTAYAGGLGRGWDRFCRTIVHEYGHMLGFHHVSNRSSIMYFDWTPRSEPAICKEGESEVSAPAVTGTVIANTTGTDTGYVKQGGTFYVYANISGSPSSVTANLSNLSPSLSPVTLMAGSYTAPDGTAYGYRSSALTAAATLAEGTTSYSITPTGGQSGSGTVVVDNTGPTATDIQTGNKPSGTQGLPEAGDTVTFTFGEPVDPSSIVSGWTGASATNVTVKLSDGGGSNDTLTIRDATNTTELPLGSVNLGPLEGDYTSGATDAIFGTAGTPSTLTRNGNSYTVTLGALASGSVRQHGGADTMVWTPSSSAFDRAINPASTTPVNESGALDNEF